MIFAINRSFDQARGFSGPVDLGEAVDLTNLLVTGTLNL